METSLVATGSWDDESICMVVWEGAGLGGDTRLVGSAEHPGYVTGLVWLSQDLLAANSYSGCPVLYRVPGMGVVEDWPHLRRAGRGKAAQH